MKYANPTCVPREGGGAGRLAALGILSYDSSRQSAMRDAIRETWLPVLRDADTIDAAFVMRGQHASAVVRRESAQHGDLVLLPSLRSNVTKRGGPLLSLMGWWRCALARWPGVQLIGKAEDDVWVSGEGVARALRRALALRPPMDTFWGAMESYTWATKRFDPHQRSTSDRGRTPAQHGVAHWSAAPLRHRLPDWGGALNCSGKRYDYARPLWAHANGGGRKSGSDASEIGLTCSRLARKKPIGYWHLCAPTIGPFIFAKGPLFFVSTRMVRRIFVSPAILTEVREAIKHAVATPMDAKGSEVPKPFEDVFTGLAVSVAADRPVRFVSISNGVRRVEYMESRLDNGSLAPTTLVLHIRDTANRGLRGRSQPSAALYMRNAHAWAARHHCEPEESFTRCWRPEGIGLAAWRGYMCGGQPFEWCSALEPSHEAAPGAVDDVPNGSRWAAIVSNSSWVPEYRVCARVPEANVLYHST